MNDYLFSFIIPHKNIPDLLQRCLDSIPLRDDIQVIIVDDNSSPDKVDFSRFPGQERLGTEVVLTKKGGGAGYARNVGLKKALGKWLIFVDADDLLAPDALSLLDRHCQDNVDIMFFNMRSVMSNDLSQPSVRNTTYRNYFENIDERNFRYGFEPLVGKVFRTEFVRKYNIRFGETRYSNDVLFSFMTGLKADKVEIFRDVLYIITQRENSLASSYYYHQKPTREECMTRVSVSLHVSRLLYKNHLDFRNRALFVQLHRLRRHYKISYLFALCRLFFAHPGHFRIEAEDLLKGQMARFMHK